MNVLGRILAGIVTVSTMVGAVALILMMLQIVVEVFLKNIISWPLPLTSIFVANYYMVIVAFLPLGLAEKLSRHISVELLFQYFSSRWQHWLGGCICLFAGIVSAGVAWQLWGEAMKRLRVGTFIVEQSISDMAKLFCASHRVRPSCAYPFLSNGDYRHRACKWARRRTSGGCERIQEGIDSYGK